MRMMDSSSAIKMRIWEIVVCKWASVQISIFITKKRRNKGLIELCPFLPLFRRIKILPDFLLDGAGQAEADFGAALRGAVEFETAV